MQTITFYPTVRRGNGTGHLVRSLLAARALEERAAYSRVFVCIEERGGRIDVEAILRPFQDIHVVSTIPESTDILLVDQRKTEPGLLERLSENVVVVALDEGGMAKSVAEFLLNMLDPACTWANADVLPTLPVKRRSFPPASISRILVTFGGEDPAGLSGPTARTLIERGVSAGSISVVRGPSCAPLELPEGVIELPADADLRERFAEYELVVTSYGLTAYEAVASGCLVATVDPSAYHAALSRKAGFFRLGAGRISVTRLVRLLNGRGDASAFRMDLTRPDVPEVLCTRRFSVVNRCPVCGSRRNSAVARFPYATFFQCRHSGLVYRVGMEREERHYESRYFFEEYRAQYGKSYLEDFDAIRKAGAERLDRIAALAKGDPSHGSSFADDAGSILDIGCAFGPFLAEARDRGYDVFGIDVVEEAIRYIEERLGIPGACVDMREFEYRDYRADRFDVVTMWYVLEHFADPGNVLSRVCSMLSPGGLFAFSTPNMAGISGRARLRTFLERSPRDHFTVMTPRSAKKILARFGFSIEMVRVTGHHPERFPLLGGRVAQALFRPVIGMLSRVCGLGDTFEIYARYTGVCEE